MNHYKKMEPLVSVVITTYNYGAYLKTCLDSVLCQGHTNLEIIVINDGSTDHTDQVIAPYLKNPLIKYVKQANAGQAVAKNKGINKGTGDYVAFLDADDYWMPEKLTKQLALFKADSQLGVVFSQSTWIDQAGLPIPIHTPRPHSGWVTNDMVIDNFVAFSSALVKRECFQTLGFFDEKLEMGIDWDLWLRFSRHYKFAFVDEKLIAYRVGHPNQMSKKQERRQEQTDFILNRFLQENPGVVPAKSLKKAQAYTYRNRGEYFLKIDKKRSLHYHLKSLAIAPLQPIIYLRIIKTLIG